MDAERFVIRSSTNKPVIGSTFTLTLTPANDKKIQEGSKDLNANLDSRRHEEPKREEKISNQTQNDTEFDEKFHAMFRGVAGEDGEVDPFELQNVLGLIFKRDFGSVKHFNLESCRSMVVMADKDRSGKLTFDQFKVLFEWIMELRKIYKNYEQNQSWDMDANDLKDALRNLGYQISKTSVAKIVTRYYNRNKRINFDDFLQICCRLKASAHAYESYQKVGDSFDDFLMHIVYT